MSQNGVLNCIKSVSMLSFLLQIMQHVCDLGSQERRCVIATKMT